ncbi:antitoxin VapB family protein [bacterium]|nr:antitoxin VapB family protein [bacterium]
MKTISLSDKAYERLLAWKNSPKDSFSSVVLRTVPKRGTLADLGEEIDKLPPLTEEQAQIMKKAVNQANDWKNYRDPWTS